MRIFKRSMFAALLALSFAGSGFAADYGLPSNIQEGNILHCFNWTISEVKANLANIAAAGYGSVQLSPLQRSDVRVGSAWHDLYRPYDLAFKGGLGTEAELQALCSEAATYGIKVIVDVVANHVDKTAGYHDTWWDSNGRVRWEGGINYGNRYSITHGQLGDYGDINSESAEVQARGKAYVEKLKSLGVRGIRWDAAKHIATPNEGCGFWSTVTSVPGMYHYGEILNDDGTPVEEYSNYMSITDNRYSNSAAKDNGGIPRGYGGAWAVDRKISDTKLVYWGESHDTYANDEWSQNVDQSVIDRAYASIACRNGATALYLARPNAKGFNNIKVGKGTDAYKANHIAQVNKFRNAMVGKTDYCVATGNAFCVTRKNGGAVIVMKGSGNISIENGGGYCPTGTYTDKVSGGTFTVTASTISGNVGSSGIAVIYDGGGDDPIINPTTGDMYILGNLKTGGWSTTPGTGAAMTGNNGVYTAKGVELVAATGETTCYFNITDKVAATWNDLNMQANRYGAATEGEAITLGTPATVVKYANNVDASGCLSWTVAPGTYDFTFDSNTMKLTVVKSGDDPIIVPGNGVTIYYDNSVTKWSTVKIHYWATPSTTWPGVDMTKVKEDGSVWSYTWDGDVSAMTGFLFHNGSGDQTADYMGVPVNKHIYKGSGNKGAVTDGGEYSDGPVQTKPVVTANPGSTSFTESVSVTLSANPVATIYYTTDGNSPTTSSMKYNAALTFTETTTLKAFAVTSEGVKGDVATYTYTKGTPIVVTGNNLITDYYKVNPNGQVGSNRTVNMNFSSANSTTALNNWNASDLIAQGVARDVAQAYKGNHERPVVDSYALYAAYDNENLYLGVQFVYEIWDQYGEGKQPGESKPYNMDGHMCWAFDLDPAKKFSGYINGTGPIWNEQQEGAYFDNGVDAVWMGSTKPGVGTPGFFIPTPDGHASYDAAYCKASTVKYGYADGLLPSIDKIWGQAEFNGDPEALKTNEGFVDLKDEIAESAHTFYEFTFPLSLLGVTSDYIRQNGIGVMYVDKYGSSPVGGTPYDPSYFDNVKDSYSQDSSSSKEKEDKDVITYSCARVGGNVSTGVGNISVADSKFTVVGDKGTLTVLGAEDANVVVAGVDGLVYYNGVGTADMTFDLAGGVYVVSVNGTSVKAVVK